MYRLIAAASLPKSGTNKRASERTKPRGFLQINRACLPMGSSYFVSEHSYVSVSYPIDIMGMGRVHAVPPSRNHTLAMSTA